MASHPQHILLMMIQWGQNFKIAIPPLPSLPAFASELFIIQFVHPRDLGAILACIKLTAIPMQQALKQARGLGANDVLVFLHYTLIVPAWLPIISHYFWLRASWSCGLGCYAASQRLGFSHAIGSLKQGVNDRASIDFRASTRNHPVDMMDIEVRWHASVV
jgi:hypothetical protein